MSNGRPLAAEVKRVLAGWLTDRGLLVPGGGTPHLRQTRGEPVTSRTESAHWTFVILPLRCPGVIVGQSGEKAAAAPVPLSQSRIKHPRLYRSGVTVGPKRLHLTRMTHNAENSSVKRGAKWDKLP